MKLILIQSFFIWIKDQLFKLPELMWNYFRYLLIIIIFDWNLSTKYFFDHQCRVILCLKNDATPPLRSNSSSIRTRPKIEELGYEKKPVVNLLLFGRNNDAEGSRVFILFTHVHSEETGSAAWGVITLNWPYVPVEILCIFF